MIEFGLPRHLHPYPIPTAYNNWGPLSPCRELLFFYRLCFRAVLSLQQYYAEGIKCQLFSRVRLFETPWTTAHQAPLSMEFSRQEYWNGLPFPSPGNLFNPGPNPGLLHCRPFLYPVSHQERHREFPAPTHAEPPPLSISPSRMAHSLQLVNPHWYIIILAPLGRRWELCLSTHRPQLSGRKALGPMGPVGPILANSAKISTQRRLCCKLFNKFWSERDFVSGYYFPRNNKTGF